MPSSVTSENKLNSLSSHNVSSRKMILHQFHRHVPQTDRTRISRDDPRQRNHPQNKETRVNFGGDVSCRMRLGCLRCFYLIVAVGGGEEGEWKHAGVWRWSICLAMVSELWVTCWPVHSRGPTFVVTIDVFILTVSACITMVFASLWTVLVIISEPTINSHFRQWIGNYAYAHPHKNYFWFGIEPPFLIKTYQ